MIANFEVFPTLAAKFLPLKMLTVLSFLIFPYFRYPMPVCWKKSVRVDALCVLAVYRMFYGAGEGTYNF